MKLNIKEILVINSKHDSYQFMYELYNDLQMLFSKLNIDIKRLDKDDDMLITHTSKYKFSGCVFEVKTTITLFANKPI